MVIPNRQQPAAVQMLAATVPAPHAYRVLLQPPQRAPDSLLPRGDVLAPGGLVRSGVEQAN